ncbi:MAG: hypothetical protein FWC41_00685 [Firmicutes bacterium]|nr:hypothetical protein [Bacillota bacterium]
MVIKAEKNYKFHVFLFLLLSIEFFILNPVEFVPKILAVSVCLGVFLNMPKIIFNFKKWYEVAAFFMSTIFLTSSFFGYDLFLKNTMLKGRFLNFSSGIEWKCFVLIYFSLGLVWASYVLQSSLNLFSFLNCKIKFLQNQKYWQKWLIFFSVMFALFMIWKSAYIVTLTRDSWAYLNGWIENKYDLAYSPVYTFLVTLVCKCAPTKPEVAWVCVIQALGFSALFSTIIAYLWEKGLKFEYALTASIILPLVPSIGLHTLTIWSDPLCGLSMLWFTYVFVRILDEVLLSLHASKLQKISFAIQLFISLILIYFVRSNTFLVAMIMSLVLCVLFLLYKKPKWLIPIVFSAFAVLIIRFPGFKMLQIENSPLRDHHRYFASIHDIQSTYYSGGKFSNHTLEVLKRSIPKLEDSEVKNNFIPDSVVYSKVYDLSELTFKEFVSIYTDSFIKNPFKILKSMFYRCRAYWVLARKNSIDFVNYTGIYHRKKGRVVDEIPELSIYRKNTILKNIVDKYIPITNSEILAIFVWRYSFWMLLIVISALWIIFQKKFIWLLVYLPLAVYVLTLFLTMGWTDYRYGLPVIFIGIFLPINFIFTKKEVT